MAEGQNAQGIADLAAHVHTTFLSDVIHADMREGVWRGLHTGPAWQHKSGNDVSKPSEAELPIDTAVLGANDPAPLETDDDEVKIPCNRYGHYVLIHEDAVEQKDYDVLGAKSKALADQAIKKLDLIAGTAALGGNNVIFAGNRADADSLQDGDVLSVRHFVQTVALLGTAEVAPFADGLYRAVLTPGQIADLFDDGAVAKGFVEQTMHAAPENLTAGQIGVWHNCAVLRSYRASSTAAAAVGGTRTLHRALFCGVEFLRRAERYPIRFSGFKEAGDLMEQHYKMLWKARVGWGVVKQTHGQRVETVSAFIQ